MAEEVDATTRQQVLDLIVEKGPVTASAIAKVLGLTTAAVRRHITLLLESKEIAEHEPGAPSKRGRGRLRVDYVATERAHIHLADGYSDLASKALGYLGQVGGEEAVESFAAARSREIERRYAPSCATRDRTLESVLRRLPMHLRRTDTPRQSETLEVAR